MTRGTILSVIRNLPKLQQLNLSGCRETLRDDCKFWFFSFTVPFVSILSDVVGQIEAGVKTFQRELVRIRLIIIILITIVIMKNKIKPQFI